MAQKPTSPRIAKLKEALDTYMDAGRFWDAAITFYARRDNSVAYFGGLPVRQVGLEGLVAKHGLPTRNADLLGLHVGVPTDVGRQTMWTKATNLSEVGLRYLRDPRAAAADRAAAEAAAAPPRASIFGIVAEPTASSGIRVLQTDAALQGIRQGDHIIAVGDTKVFTLGDLRETLAPLVASDKAVLMLVSRDGMQHFLNVKLPKE
ncbi:hypothetical protein GHT07_20685 [Caenimonas koreensis DSM 17982]|uniref:PDZ domain-containing protein n=1 Tax=Caenimonas koreensis DSM 17982 TaxID=1121255 RepID=A0A844B0A6_9BURK|nr:hypothetical protein [Caenimonas koreensis]MRD49694.1 hypothetical protein [Caenimonas koreensis DSM 17982]